MKTATILRFGAAILAAAAFVSCKSSTTSAPTSSYSIVPISTPAPHGHTWGEWSGMWWNWALSMPATANPLTGTAAAETGQSGTVWFLAGSNQSDTATRTITIPSGTSLFVPILNGYGDTVGGYPTLDSLTILARPSDQMRSAWVLSADIDGNSVTNPHQYWVDTTRFTSHLVANNIMGEPATTSAACSDGYYLMIDDLSVGSHTIHFHSSMGAMFTLDITYKVTVQ